MFSFALLCFLPACTIAYLGTAAMRYLAPRWGLMDQPAARKVHLIPTPLGGGIGIWLGVVLPLTGALAVAWAIPMFPFLTDWLPDQIRPHLDGVKYRSGRLWAILAGGTFLSIMG